MKTHKLFVAFVVPVSLVIATVGSASADASAPEQFRVPVDQTQILTVCGFPVLRHDEGTLIFQDSFDANGNVL